MKRALIRLAAVAASCCLLAEGLALPADAATPVTPTNIITIPSPDQVTGAIDPSVCPWRVAYDAALTESETKASDADSHSMSEATVPSDAPLVAALCAMLGG